MARHNIPQGRGRNRAMDVILDDDAENLFDVSAEDVPADWPSTYQGQTITWLSNFTLKKKPGKEKTGKKVGYTIELDRITGKLISYDPVGQAFEELTTRGAGNRLQADLSADDPGIGKIG